MYAKQTLDDLRTDKLLSNESVAESVTESEPVLEDAALEKTLFLVYVSWCVCVLFVHVYGWYVGNVTLKEVGFGMIYVIFLASINMLGYIHAVEDDRTFSWYSQPCVVATSLLVYDITVRHEVLHGGDMLRNSLAFYIVILYALDLLYEYEQSTSLCVILPRVAVAFVFFCIPIYYHAFSVAYLIFLTILSPQIFRLGLCLGCALLLSIWDVMSET